MTRFDAPASSSASDSVWRIATRLVAVRIGMVAAAFLATTIAFAAAILLIDAGAAVPVALRQAFVASPVQVFVAPGASRGDAEALGPKLTALPHVAGATLRRKEDALAALVATGVPAPTDGRNPLPDVWTVTLRGDGSFFTTEAVTVRDAISAFSGVDRVRYDEAWVGAVDRAAAAWSQHGVAWLAGALAVVAVASLCIFVLAGRALTLPGASVPGASLALAGLGVVTIAAAVAFSVCSVILAGVAGVEGAVMKPIVGALGLNLDRSALAVFPAGLLLAAFGGWLGHREGQSHR